jgi:membrane protease subunit HflC
MRRSLPSIIAGVVLIVALGLYMVTYQVRLNEVAVVRTFGKIAAPNPETGKSPDIKEEPGLYWKWPWPIQRVVHYDDRLQISATTGEETPTRDGKNVIVTTAIGWRIADPFTFHNKNRNMSDAEDKLKSQVRNDQKSVISAYDFANFVSDNPNELKYDQIELAIRDKVLQKARENYGIEVEYIGIEKLALPKTVTESVFSAMREERNAQAARYTSAGESEAERIKAEAESIAGTIQAFAEGKADDIVAQGKFEAAQFNRIFAQDEELAVFLLEMDYLLKILKERATIILDAQPPFDLLREATATRPSGETSPTTQPSEGMAEPPPAWGPLENPPRPGLVKPE